MPFHTHHISAEPDLLGESPVSDAGNGCLYWVDGVSRLVRRFDLASGARRDGPTASMVGSIGLTETDGMSAQGIPEPRFALLA